MKSKSPTGTLARAERSVWNRRLHDGNWRALREHAGDFGKPRNGRRVGHVTSTSVVLPSNGATVSGAQALDAVASYGANGVAYQSPGERLTTR